MQRYVQNRWQSRVLLQMVKLVTQLEVLDTRSRIVGQVLKFEYMHSEAFASRFRDAV